MTILGHGFEMFRNRNSALSYRSGQPLCYELTLYLRQLSDTADASTNMSLKKKTPKGFQTLDNSILLSFEPIYLSGAFLRLRVGGS